MPRPPLILLCLAGSAHAAELGLQLGADGSYAVQVEGATWLQSGPISVRPSR